MTSSYTNSWSAEVARGPSGATVVEFVDIADVESHGIRWAHVRLTYALRYPNGLYAPGCGSYSDILAQLRVFEEKFADDNKHMPDDGIAEEDFVNGDWPREVAKEPAPDWPSENAAQPRSRPRHG